MFLRLLPVGAFAVLYLFSLYLFQVKVRQRSFLPLALTKGKRTYLGLRNRALHSAGTFKPLTPLGTSDPRVILMDWRLENRTVTTVAFADGTVSVYMSNGGCLLGGGQGYESIRKAGENMLALAREFQPQMHETRKYPLPSQGQVNFYLGANSGVFAISASEFECKTRMHPLTGLYFAGQEIITQYRLAHSSRGETAGAGEIQRETI